MLSAPPKVKSPGGTCTTDEPYDSAIRTYRQIIEKSPASFDAENAWVCIGKIQLATRSFRAAETTLREDLRRFPKGKETREAAFYFGDALYYQGNIRQAIQIYQTAMGCRSRSAPTDLKALESLSVLFEKRGDTDRALDLLSLGLNLASTTRNRKNLLKRIMALYRHANRLKEVTALRSIVEPYLASDPSGKCDAGKKP
jgi:tetratricopeptide (TPR) repeat protein